ncbi:LysR family transcriptional regulator [Roseibium sp. CAU 1637]|uniref:LysR family transcriptional regulator n=1 Tax=Roseibium limicola TaxID=2816037 RepID=A0A939EKM7_9HYPH|nr:LysR family transcriptional regulator [Roseibium limicola]MBO0344309.1 LysR family transcriptional regulator [Roseibium limicola]
MRTDYLGLEAFVAIAELGSFSRAASYLNLSQTALSHRVRKLEADLGVQLIMRTTRDVSLTKEAQGLLPQVRRDLRQLADAYSGLKSRGTAREEKLAFACLPTIANYYMPSILKAFARECPDVHIRLQDQPVGRVYDLVQEGEVEFGITVVGARQWDLDFHEIYTEPYVLLVPQDHPLAERDTITRADLSGQEFVRIETQSTNRKLIDEALGDHSSSIIWRYEVQNSAMAMRMVAEGVALTVLPALASSLFGPELKALHFSDVKMQRTLGFVTRKGITLSRPASRLLEMTRERLARQGEPKVRRAALAGAPAE